MGIIKKWLSKHNLLILFIFVALTAALLCYVHYKLCENKKKIDEIEYKDSVNTYNRLYYETSIKELKKKNRELYDSLKNSKDKIDFLIQFTAKKEYNTGKVIVKDTVYIDSTNVPKTFEYTNVSPNDTMNYILKINSNEEPNWYSLNIKTSSKYTIVNKDYDNGLNHITINDETHTSDITDVTVFKKKEKKTFWKRFSFGPSVTAGYDVCNKQFGIMVGASATFDLK